MRITPSFNHYIKLTIFLFILPVLGCKDFDYSMNQKPIAADDDYSTFRNVPLTGTNVLANDIDPDGNDLVVQQFIVVGDAVIYQAGNVATLPGVGTLSLSENGSLTFTPALNYVGLVPDVTYTINDSKGETSSAVIHTSVVSTALLNTPFSIFVEGDYAYIASGGSNALEIVEVSNPLAPRHRGSLIDGNGGVPYLNNAFGVYVSNSYAFVASRYSYALEIVDVSSKGNPVHKGSIIQGSGGALFINPRSVFVKENYCYVVSESSGLEIIDITSPANPTFVGGVAHGEGGAMLEGATWVQVVGNFAYVTSYLSDALEIINVSDPANPIHAGVITHGQGGAKLDGPISVFVKGNYAFVASEVSDALEIVDISNPNAPTHAASVDNTFTTPLDGVCSIVVSGNYAYMTSRIASAFEIIDVTNPLAPIHKGSLKNNINNLIPNPGGVFINGNIAYVICRGEINKLVLINISNPAAPELISSLNDGQLIGG